MEKTEITFARPVTMNGQQVTSVTMREPTVEDQIAGQEAANSPWGQEVATFANLCEVSPEDIRRLPLREYSKLQAAYADFL